MPIGQVLKCGFMAIALAAGVANAASAQAANAVDLTIAKLTHPQLSAERLHLRIEPKRDGSPASLRLQAASLRVDSLDQTLRDVEFACSPTPSDQPVASGESNSPPADSPRQAAVAGDKPTLAGHAAMASETPSTPAAPIRWRCEGPLRWRRGGTGWSIAWEADEALTHANLRLAQGTSEIAVQLPLGGDVLAVTGKRVPTKWLAQVAPQLTWQDGRIDGRVEMTPTRANAARWRGQLRARSLGAEGANGSIALAGIDIGGAIDVTRSSTGLRIDAAPTLTRGELLAGPVYLAWPADSAMAMELALSTAGDDWKIERLKISDGGFVAEAQGLLRTAGAEWLQSLNVDASVDLSSRYARYLDGAMASLGQPGLIVGGAIKSTFALGIGGIVNSVDATLTDVSVRHAEDRYALDGLAGTLAFRRGEGEPAPSDLRWRSLALHALDFGGGTFHAQSRAGELRATQPLALTLFGGDVVASDLVYRPLAADGDRVQASVNADGIDIAVMAKAFDWPAFTGRLDGSFPQMRYAGDVLSVGGEIGIKVFGGDVRVAQLSVERPFGVAPALSGEIALAGLDLQPMTEIFGLGRIEGRLNGQVNGLRLLDWSPTAFDARLHTAEGGRRRISQLAVEQLTQIGGGGGAAGIQGKLLGVFDSFGYRRIGLSCRLANNICEMGGVDESAGGYTILQGSGLPLITIRGFQTRVDWPVLVGRLKAIVAGQRPVVD